MYYKLYVYYYSMCSQINIQLIVAMIYIMLTHKAIDQNTFIRII